MTRPDMAVSLHLCMTQLPLVLTSQESQLEVCLSPLYYNTKKGIITFATPHSVAAESEGAAELENAGSYVAPAPRLLLHPPPWWPSACIVELYSGARTIMSIDSPEVLWPFYPVLDVQVHWCSPLLGETKTPPSCWKSAAPAPRLLLCPPPSSCRRLGG